MKSNIKYETREVKHVAGNKTGQYDASPKKAPMLLLLAGFAGVGKTTLAQRINTELNWKILNKDDLKRRRLAEGEEEMQAGWNAFDELFELIRQEAMIKGNSIIIDTSNEKPFIFANMLNMLEKMNSQQMHAHLKVVLCIADKETRIRRLNTRGSVFAPYIQKLPPIPEDSELEDHFKHLLDEDSELKNHFKHLLPKEAVFTVDTNLSLEDYAQHVVNEVLKDFSALSARNPALN